VRPGARHVAVSLHDADALREALSSGFDAVLHFAALSLVAESVEHPERYWSIRRRARGRRRDSYTNKRDQVVTQRSVAR
jgi:NAD dependent epimerase/dehydratase family